MSTQQITQKNLKHFDFPISVISEHTRYSQSLHQVTLFPHVNSHVSGGLSRIVISFRFRAIEFSKKRALPFFLAMELLTNRKCVASLSSRNIQAWKIRQGRLVGAKVTLRRESLFGFIDTLGLTLPRREKYQPTQNYFSKLIKKVRSSPKKFEPTYSISLGELVLFYPIELGLGLHPDVQRVELKFIFKSLALEEQYFYLRYFKIPVL